jgi:acyl-CoA synthetase (AMP-forming)/AMP-acid ligase II
MINRSAQVFHGGTVTSHRSAIQIPAAPPAWRRRPASQGPATLVELLRQRTAAAPDALAYDFLEDGEERSMPFTRAELDRRARHVAAVLQGAGATGGTAVLLFQPGADYVTAFWGCLYAGVIAVPAYPPQDNRHAQRIQRILQDAGARFILTSEGLRDPIAAQLQGFPIEVLAPLGDPADRSGEWREPRIGASSLAFLQYTSGSTGSPRGVMLSHANLLYNSELIRQAFGVTPEDRMVSWLPPYHDMGLIGGILQPVYAGCSTVMMTPVHFLQRPLRWLRAISRHRGTISGGPNFAYDLCLRKVTPEQRAELDLSSWKVALNGAEPVQARTLRQFAEAFGPAGFRESAFYPCYGLAEATLMVSGGERETSPVARAFDPAALEAGQAQATTAADGHLLIGCGRTRLAQEIRIVDPQSCVSRRDGEIGEIWVSGPSIATGYWRRKEESMATFAGRVAESGEGTYLRTGDLGFLHEGELFVTGRIKDLIIIRGRNHYPQDIEEVAAASHPALRPGGGAAFAVPVNGDEALVIVHEVQRTAVRSVDPEAVGRAVRIAIAEQLGLQVHDVVLLRPAGLPKTSSGKVQRRACRQQYLEGSLPALEPAAGAEAVAR